jgi:hypothetical protein
VYFASCRLLNSSRNAKFGGSGHCRITAGDFWKTAAERPHFKTVTVRYRPLAAVELCATNDSNAAIAVIAPALGKWRYRPQAARAGRSAEEEELR